MRFVLLSGALLVPAMAQTEPGTGTTANSTDDRDNGFNMGWLGLVGLAGLLGMRRREDQPARNVR